MKETNSDIVDRGQYQTCLEQRWGLCYVVKKFARILHLGTWLCTYFCVDKIKPSLWIWIFIYGLSPWEFCWWILTNLVKGDKKIQLGGSEEKQRLGINYFLVGKVHISTLYSLGISEVGLRGMWLKRRRGRRRRWRRKNNIKPPYIPQAKFSLVLTN